ncbi:MAG: serine/threonine protein kinase [Deltaproteobacteria bacterium]|nr:serine/threonine protein kinase [Deltaproteobacteria bacterium]
MPEYRIGPYRLVRRLGRGSSATVVEAIDERVGRKVALKVPHADRVADASARAELEREAHLAASIRSPFVVRVLELVVDGPSAAIVLEHVEAVTLARLCRHTPADPGPLTDPALAALVAHDVARGLADIHAAVDIDGAPLGLVHGDIGPDNVLVDVEGTTRVTDLGLARRRAVTAATASGLVRGTPGYVAPEVVRGSPATPLSEVFAVGVLLWEMRAGRPAFARPDPIAALRATVEERLEPFVDPLGEVIDRATAKRPERRHGSAASLAEALASFTDESLREHVARIVGSARIG